MDMGTDVEEKRKRSKRQKQSHKRCRLQEAAILCRASGRVLIKSQNEAYQREAREKGSLAEWGVRHRSYWSILEKG